MSNVQEPPRHIGHPAWPLFRNRSGDVARNGGGRTRAARTDFDITMAFQPIVDVDTGIVFAHEALVRGTAGQGAGEVLSRITREDLHDFDQACRTKALGLARSLGLAGALSLNFLPNAVNDPEACLQATLAAVERTGFPFDRIILEVTEVEEEDAAHLHSIVNAYRKRGFRIALDDFGAGSSGLRRLVELRPDVVKLDMSLIRGIGQGDAYRCALVAAMVGFCRDAGIELVAEGIEDVSEATTLRRLGIRLQQGFLFARPAFETAATVSGLPLPA